MTDKLGFTTLALRRELASDHHEMSPVIAPAVVAYGGDDQVAGQLQLALSELPDEARPTTVARYLLPAGVRLEHLALELGREGLPGRLARRHPVTITVIAVPEPRADGAPSGHWVFIPVLDHACFVARNEDLEKRIAAELEVLPAALALSIDGWKRLLTWARPSLERSRIRGSSPTTIGGSRCHLHYGGLRASAPSGLLDGAARELAGVELGLELDDDLGELGAEGGDLVIGELYAGELGDVEDGFALDVHGGMVAGCGGRWES